MAGVAMRLLLILLLFCPPLFAIDLDEVDRDTLRHVRLALLKDEIRGHFGLRIGDFESLDQALSATLDDEPLLILRMGSKGAAVLIETGQVADQAGEHLFFELENAVSAKTLIDGEYVALRCQTAEGGPEKTRLLRLEDAKPQLCHCWISAEETSLEGGRYMVCTTRAVASGPALVETTEYMLDGKRVEGGLATYVTTLIEGTDGLVPGTTTQSAISVTGHCAMARSLERDGLNEAALFHASAALTQAKLDKLADDDARYLEAQALSAKLEARLRPAVVEK